MSKQDKSFDLGVTTKRILKGSLQGFYFILSRKIEYYTASFSR